MISVMVGSDLVLFTPPHTMLNLLLNRFVFASLVDGEAGVVDRSIDDAALRCGKAIFFQIK